MTMNMANDGQNKFKKTENLLAILNQEISK